jgi:hypothetical protein
MRVPSVALSTAVVLICGLAASSRAAVTIVQDKLQWQLLVGGPFLTEDFADSQLNAGVSFVSSESGHINPAQECYQDVLASTSQNSPMTTWSFAPPVTAVGGNWTLGGPGGSGNSLLVYLDESTYVGSISNDYGGGFWGFTADAPFSSVKLIGGSGSNQQNDKLDDMVYAPVPEPSALLLLGVVSAGMLMRRTRAGRAA